MKKEVTSKNCGVYCIKSATGVILYIGASMNIVNRFNDHVYRLKNNKHKNISLQNISNKVECGNLTFSILKFCNNDDLFIYEELLIKSLNPICNVRYSLTSNNVRVNDVDYILKDWCEKTFSVGDKIYNKSLVKKYLEKFENERGIDTKTILKKLKKSSIEFKKGNDVNGRYLILC
jgi:excinuclease UvrABC nuclease subunit